MNAVEYLKEKARMTKECSIDCISCPLSRENNSEGLMCGTLADEFPEVAIEIVQKWAEEHPKKTMLQDFLEKYPKAPLTEYNVPYACVYALGYTDRKMCNDMTCRECWKMPLEGDGE